MKQLGYTLGLTLVMGALTVAGAHEGCQKPTAKTKAKAAVKKAICSVCAVKGGHSGPEPVKATVKYKGKQYAFCNLGCKAEFIAKPAKFASAVK
jgi:YHS domain-containing protein